MAENKKKIVIPESFKNFQEKTKKEIREANLPKKNNPIQERAINLGYECYANGGPFFD